MMCRAGGLKRNELAGDYFVALMDEFIRVTEKADDVLAATTKGLERMNFLGVLLANPAAIRFAC